MTKKSIWLVAIMISLLVVGMVFFAYLKKAEQRPDPLPVNPHLSRI